MMKKLFALLLVALFALVPLAQALVPVELTSPEAYNGDYRLYCWVSMPEKRGSGHDEIHITEVSANIARIGEDVHGDANMICTFLCLSDPVNREWFQVGHWHWGGYNSTAWLYVDYQKAGEYHKIFIAPAEPRSYNYQIITDDESTHCHAIIDGAIVYEFDFSSLVNRMWYVEMESTWMYNVAGSIAAGLLMHFQFYQDGWKTGITNWRNFGTRVDYPYGMILYYTDTTYTFLDGVKFRGGFDYGLGGGGGGVCYHK